MTVQEQEAEEKNFWVPRFRVEVKQENIWSGLDAGETGLVLNSAEAAHFELYAPEASLGAIQLDPSYPTKEQNIIIEKDFIFAITQSELNEQLDVPFFICEVPKRNW